MNRRQFNKKMTPRELRVRIAARGILTIGDLARQIGCSRPSIYFALERPERYPRVFEKILQVIE